MELVFGLVTPEDTATFKDTSYFKGANGLNYWHKLCIDLDEEGNGDIVIKDVVGRTMPIEVSLIQDLIGALQVAKTAVADARIRNFLRGFNDRPIRQENHQQPFEKLFESHTWPFGGTGHRPVGRTSGGATRR